MILECDNCKYTNRPYYFYYNDKSNVKIIFCNLCSNYMKKMRWCLHCHRLIGNNVIKTILKKRKKSKASLQDNNGSLCNVCINKTKKGIKPHYNLCKNYSIGVYCGFCSKIKAKFRLKNQNHIEVLEMINSYETNNLHLKKNVFKLYNNHTLSIKCRYGNFQCSFPTCKLQRIEGFKGYCEMHVPIDVIKIIMNILSEFVYKDLLQLIISHTYNFDYTFLLNILNE